MALTVPAMSHTTHENNSLMNAHPSTFWPQSHQISSSAPVDAYVQSGSPPSPSHHGHQAYYDENNMMMNMMEMQRNYLLTGSGSPPMNGSGGEGRAQRSGSATGSGNRTPSRNSSSQDQYSAQLYKTELCRSFKDTGYCRYGLKCRFAHGTPDLRPVQRHKKYKTEKCKNYQRDGNCPYGDRCRFLHEDGELEELLLAEQMDGLVQATVSGTGSQNTSVPASPYFTATGSPPQDNELDLRGAQHLYESGTSSRFNATKPITTARGSMIGSTPPHHSYHPHNPYSQHNTSQSVPTNLDLHPSLYRRGQELTGSISTDFSYGSPHITYGNDDDEVLGRLDDDDGWMTHQQRVAKKQHEHVRQQYQQQQQQQQTFQQHLDITTNGNDDYNSFNSHLTQHHSPLLLHRGNQSSDDIDRLTDDVMDAQSAVRSAFTTSDMTSFHSQSTPVSLGSTPTAPTRSPLLLSAVPRSPIIGPSVWSTTVTETRTAGSTPGHATPTGFSTAPRSSTSIPSSSQGSPFFSSLIPPSGRSTGAMPAFSLSSSAQPIPGVSHMRSTSGNLSRTQALAMEMTKGTDEAVGDDDLLAATSSRRKKIIGTSFLSTTRAPQLSMDSDDVDELDLHALIINDVTPTAFSTSDEDTPATGRFRSVSLNLPTHTSSQAISINATSTTTSTSSASWYGSATASPTSSSSNQSPHANAFSHSFSLPSAATTLSTSVPRGIPSPLQRFQAPLQSTTITTSTTTSTSGSSSPSAAPSSPHGPMGSTPSSANSSSRRLRIFANLTTAQQQQQQQPQALQQPPSFTLPVLGTSPNPPSLVPTTETTPNPSPGSDVS